MEGPRCYDMGYLVQNIEFAPPQAGNDREQHLAIGSFFSEETNFVELLKIDLASGELVRGKRLTQRGAEAMSDLFMQYFMKR